MLPIPHTVLIHKAKTGFFTFSLGLLPGLIINRSLSESRRTYDHHSLTFPEKLYSLTKLFANKRINYTRKISFSRCFLVHRASNEGIEFVNKLWYSISVEMRRVYYAFKERKGTSGVCGSIRK